MLPALPSTKKNDPEKDDGGKKVEQAPDAPKKGNGEQAKKKGGGLTMDISARP